MDMKHEIFGISTELTNNFSDEFNEYLELFEERIYFSKKYYSHDDEDGLNFGYRYGIRVTDMSYFDGKGFVVELMMIPDLFSMTAEKQMQICGDDYDRIEGLNAFYEVMEYGCAVPIGSEKVETEQEVESVLEDIASVYGTIDGLRGFYLDRAVNLLGTTGWDLLRDYVVGEDFLNLGM